MLWLYEPNHGAALRAALQRWQRQIHKNHPLILCQRVFILPWEPLLLRYYSFLSSFALLSEVAGPRFLGGFSSGNKKEEL